MNALLKAAGYRLDGVVNCWSRHPVPRAFCLLRFVGDRDEIIGAFNFGAPGLRVLHHPTLGAKSDALFLQADGRPMAHFFGDNYRAYPWTDSPGYEAPSVADTGVVDVWVLGHCSASSLFPATDGTRAIGLKLPDAVLLASFRPQALIHRSDTGQWANAHVKWKNPDGRPRIDLDALRDLYATVSAPPPPEPPA